MLSRLSLRSAALTLCAISGSAFVGSLVLQHFFGLEPCPTCILQRLGFLLLALVSLPFLLTAQGRGPTLAFRGVTGLVALAGVGMALFHAAMLAGWLDASCSLTVKFYLMDLQAVLPEFASAVLEGQGACTPVAGVRDYTAELVAVSFIAYMSQLVISQRATPDACASCDPCRNCG